MQFFKFKLIILILNLALASASGTNLDNDIPSPKTTFGSIGQTSDNLNQTPTFGLGLRPIKDFNIKGNILGYGGIANPATLCRSQSIPPTAWTVEQHKSCARYCINQPAPNIGGRCTADGICTCAVLA